MGKSIKANFIYKPLHWLYNIRVRKLKEPTFEESKLIAELQREIFMLPKICSKTSSKADMIWVMRRKQLRELVLKDDPRRFLSWRVITATMFVNYAPYIRQELIDLMNIRDWHARWKVVIR